MSVSSEMKVRVFNKYSVYLSSKLEKNPELFKCDILSPNFTPIYTQHGMLLAEFNNKGCSSKFSIFCEHNSCLINDLSLTNGPTEIWDTNLESFPSSRDFYPSIGISVYDVYFGWIPD